MQKSSKGPMKIVAVTACAAGIAHTYMAAESIEKAAKARGDQVKVETDGAMGAENVLTAVSYTHLTLPTNREV